MTPKDGYPDQLFYVSAQLLAGGSLNKLHETANNSLDVVQGLTLTVHNNSGSTAESEIRIVIRDEKTNQRRIDHTVQVETSTGEAVNLPAGRLTLGESTVIAPHHSILINADGASIGYKLSGSIARYHIGENSIQSRLANLNN